MVRSWRMVTRLRQAKLRQLGLEKGNYSDNKAIVVRKWGRWRDSALLTLASMGTQSGHIAAPANYLTLPKPHFGHRAATLGYLHSATLFHVKRTLLPQFCHTAHASHSQVSDCGGIVMSRSGNAWQACGERMPYICFALDTKMPDMRRLMAKRGPNRGGGPPARARPQWL